MPTKKLFFLLLFLPFLCLQAFAQQDSSSANTITHSFSAANFFNSDSTQPVNTSLDQLQNFWPAFYLGNTGLASLPLQIPQANTTSGFLFAPDPYHYDRFSFEKLPYYTTRSPFSSIFFLLGTKKEQVFDMTFSYNVKKNWNVSADFRRVRSEGFYKRQQTNNNDFALNSSFHSKNNRYALLAAIILNSRESAENGGFQSDSAFLYSDFSSSLIDVQLTGAKSRNFYKGISIQQFLQLGKVAADTNLIQHPSSQLFLNTTFSDKLNEFTDNSPSIDYYQQFLHDSVSTYDSSYYSNLENTVGWKRLDNGLHRGFKDVFGIELNAQTQYVHVKQYNADSSFLNVIPHVRFYSTYPVSDFSWNLAADYAVSGYNATDMHVSAEFKKYFLSKKLEVLLFGHYAKEQPFFLAQRIRSNHFYWENSYDQSTKLTAGLRLKIPRTASELTFSSSTITDPIYFDQFAQSRQSIGSIAVLGATLQQNFTAFNWHLDNQISYQLVPDSCILHVPELISQNSLYYENDVFHHATRVQIGLELRYFSGYYANAFMPVTSQYYLQDQTVYGNYPFVNFFLNMKVKNFRLFFLIDHLNEGLTGSNYLLAPGTAMSGRAYKLGISWKFFD